MKQRSSFRLSPEAMHLLAALAQANGISMTAVLELAIREKAKRQGIHADPGLQAQSHSGPTDSDR
jgi:predicted transcriptional regulator